MTVKIVHNSGERQAAKLRGDKYYFTNKPCKNGHISLRFVSGSSCIVCNAEKKTKLDKNLTDEEIKKRNEYQKKYQIEWLEKHPEAYKKRQVYKKNWMTENNDKVLANKAKRRASELQRTPNWLNSGDYFEMESIYKYSSSLRSIGLDYHVDHIIPLQGKNVSGFHVPWNLQVIHSTENFKKGNRHYV